MQLSLIITTDSRKGQQGSNMVDTTTLVLAVIAVLAVVTVFAEKIFAVDAVRGAVETVGMVLKALLVLIVTVAIGWMAWDYIRNPHPPVAGSTDPADIEPYDVDEIYRGPD
jgi:hypothetical protein